MSELTPPAPSVATIIKASVVALIMAGIVFVSVILPVEYKLDPTGVGKLLGLTVLSEASNAIQAEQSSEKLSEVLQENEVVVLVPANKGVEYKFKMQKYGHMTFQWASDSEALYFDFHGEPKGDTTGYFESYSIATADKVSGSITVPFDGVHGWYWKNNSNEDAKVTLRTQGNYELIGLIH